jgi:hypothetical protein
MVLCYRAASDFLLPISRRAWHRPSKPSEEPFAHSQRAFEISSLSLSDFEGLQAPVSA